MPAAQKPKNIYQKLLAITAEATVPKGGTADKKIGGYAFHKIDDVDAALGILFAMHQVQRSINVLSMDTQVVKTHDGKNDYVSTTTIEVTYTNADNPDEQVVAQSVGRGIDRADKSEGKAISYASKNHSLSFFCMRGQPDVEDDSHEHHQPTANGRTITEPQQRRLFALAKEAGWKPAGMKEWLEKKFGYGHSNDIPMSEYDAVVEFFTAESPDSAASEEGFDALPESDLTNEPPDGEGLEPPEDAELS